VKTGRLAPFGTHLAPDEPNLAPSGSTPGVIGTRLGVVKFILDLAGLTPAPVETSFVPLKSPIGFAKTSLVLVQTLLGVIN
jgi:hypothetical protein